MYEVLITHNDLIKKSTKKDPQIGRKNFHELIKKLNDTPEWTRSELAEFRIELFGTLDVMSMMDPVIYSKLQEKNVHSIDEWDGKEIYWFYAQTHDVKKTKAGKVYITIDAVGPVGKIHKINVWGWSPGKSLAPFTLCAAEVDKNEIGMSTTTWKLRVLV